MDYLEFKQARCKDCYKCLRECPVKAIDVKDHQAKIILDRCILCGHCTTVCPQNAKVVHSEMHDVKRLLAGSDKVIASVAPSFVSSFNIQDFNIFKIALGKLGFNEAQETSVAANEVTNTYRQQLESGNFKNYITSACPAACRLIQLYYPKALKYLAPVDSPMIAHAKMLRKQYPEAKIIFIGPCIAKKREAAESDLLDGVLTFEDLQKMFDESDIVLSDITKLPITGKNKIKNLAKVYPISHGIIKSFPYLPEGYEYMAVDGMDRCTKIFDNIDQLSGMFIELNTCPDACVNGPCSLYQVGGSVKATADLKSYAKKDVETTSVDREFVEGEIDFTASYPRLRNKSMPATEKDIQDILAKTGKFNPEDELNCGACGYSTCREKAWAV